MEEPLLFHVGLDQSDPLLGAAGEPEILQGHFVNREDGAGGPVLGRHVPDGGSIGQRQAGEARAVEFHELAHHAFAAEKLGYGEHQVCRRGSLGQPPLQPESDHLGYQHGDGLSQHGGFGLDPSDSPAQHPQTIDHGGMRVGAHQGIRVGLGQLSA